MSIYSSKGDGPEALNEAEQSEKRLRSVLDGMTDAYYVLDREWRFAEIDGRAPVYFGRTREELAGRCIWELYPQYEGSKMWEEYHRAVFENVPVHFETRSASGYFFEVHAYPQPDGLAVYLRDITGRKRAEEARRESERKYERLIKYAPAAIYEIDFQKNRFISVNDAMCLMSGYSREELLAMDPFDIIDEQSRVTFKKRLEQWLKDDEPINRVDYIARAKDGREAWVALNVSFTRDENGAPLGAMAVAQDISDRKRAEERIKLQNTILQAINKAYEQYVLCGTLEELRKACLDIIEEITGSAISFIGEIGKDGLFHDTAISTTGWEQCEVLDSMGQKRKTGDFPIRGLYGSVLRNAKTLMTNDPGSHKDSMGVPEGHIALTAFLGVPFIQCGNVTGMAAVANRNGGYTDNEKEILEAVTPTVCEVLLRKRAEEALRESEQRLHSAAKNSSFEFSQFDTDLRYLWIDNPQMDLEPSQILGKRDIDLEDSEGMSLLYDLKRQVIKNGKSACKEICFNRRDGLHTYDFFIDPVFENRKIIGGTSLALDVTKHKKEQEELAEDKERLNALMDHNPSLVFLKDEEGRYVYINKTYETNFASPGSWYGKTDFDFWPKESAELFRTNDAYVLNSGQTMQFMEDSTDLEGKRHCWLNYKFPFTDSKNRKYIGGIGIDATRLILAEEALHDRSRELEEANRQNTDILESISDCFYALDKELRFVYVNKRAEEIWGIPRADLIGRSIEEVFKGLIDISLSKFRIAMKEQTPQHYELYSKITDRWGEISVYPTRDGISVYFRDITESKKAEEALQISEANFRAVFECSPLGIVAGDMEGRIVQSNPAIEHMLGYSKEELRGKAFSEFTYDEDLNIVTPLINELIEGKEDYYEIEKRYILKSGQVIWIKLIVTLMQGGSGEKLGLAMIEDITERKKAEEALRESEERTRSLLDELAKTDSNKNDFLSSLSHELRNPLGVISAGLQLMDMTKNEAQAASAKEIIGRQMNQLCRLVDDLLDLMRITNNKITLKKEHIELNRLVSLTLKDYKPLFNKKKIRLKVNSGGRLYSHADPVRVKQIIGNLLHNALKFTNAGGEVTVSAYKEDAFAIVCVKDTGIGIKAGDIPKLFEPFSQAGNHIDRANGGLGLGLSIVREIARLHGGSAEAESAGEGQGASFYIRLPLESAGKESKTEDGLPAENAGKLKVLLIEDNRDYSDMLCSMLRVLGHEAAAAYDGAGGLKAAEAYLPDVIICDIGLPGMNGYEVARAVTSGGMAKRPYMAALSGYARPQDIEAAKQAGFDRHIAKPVTLETLKQILAAVRQ